MSLKDALAGIKEAQAEPIEPEAVTSISTAAPRRQVKAANGKSRQITPIQAETTGAKSSNPDFMQLKVYVRKITKRQAARKWEDENGGDVSDLIEKLLQQYLSS
jgi:hypothetical protein